MPSPPKKTLRTPVELAAAGLVPAERVAELKRVAARYAIAVTPTIAALIDPSDPNDPIARQFIPDIAELDHSALERRDPIGDYIMSPVEGVVHRYPDRVLLKLVQSCSVYCRFCFRREMIGPHGQPALSDETLGAALNYVRSDWRIWEVILSGGDPLVLSPRRLGTVVAALGGIEHVRVIRVHTRLPVSEPQRINASLIRALQAPGKTTYVVLHANHPRELTLAARAACARIVDAGLPMLSQSVLLRGVNDDVATLGALMRAFVETRIKPYYLHHGDLAPGTAHLRTSIADGQRLMRDLRGDYSGLCQPAYMVDIPGGYGKSPAGPSYVSTVRADGTTRYEIEDFHGRRHDYPPEPSPRRRSAMPRARMLARKSL
jgi:lysine 2,3-aminomutase